MSTIREATFDCSRAHGMTRIFGNPGSTELPMLKDFPDDFSYVLGLQELVVVGMADGFAQASGGPAHANLHTAPGRRQRRRRDLQRPGQQVPAADHRRPAGAPPDHLRGQPHQPRSGARPAAVREVGPRTSPSPRTSRWRSRARSTTPRCPPAGRPSCRSRWTTGASQADEDALTQLLARGVHARALPDPVALEDLAGACRRPPTRC